MNPDQIAAEDEAFENIVTAILQCQKGTARQFFKSAIEKATRKKDDRIKQLEATRDELQGIISRQSRAAHASETYSQFLIRRGLPDEPQSWDLFQAAAHASEADDYVGINKIVKKHGEACRMAVIEAYELGKAPAHASEGGAIEDDNCFRCGRPLGWCEPQLCEECRALEDKPTPATASETVVSDGLGSHGKIVLKPDSATASDFENDATLAHIEGHKRGKPDSASTGKHSMGEGANRSQRLRAHIPEYAATPSGGREWTHDGHTLIAPTGQRFVIWAKTDEPTTDAENLASVINATLRDCGNDTKRLDWFALKVMACTMSSDTTMAFHANWQYGIRQAIDAAMSQTKEGK